MASSILTPALISTTITTVSTLVDFIERIQNAPTKVQSIQDELKALQPSLGVLSDSTRQINGSIQFAGLAVENCQASCATFNGKLTSWTKSEDGLTKWEAVKIGTLRNAQLDSFQRELNNHKLTVMLVLHTANLVHDEKLDNKIEAMTGTLSKAVKELSYVRLSLTWYKEYQLNEENDGNEEERRSLLRSLEAQEASIKCLQEVYKKELAQATKTAIDVGDVQAETNSQAFAGLRVDSGNGDVDIKVKQVTSKDNSNVYTGIVATETAFLRFRPSPDEEGATSPGNEVARQ